MHFIIFEISFFLSDCKYDLIRYIYLSVKLKKHKNTSINCENIVEYIIYKI